MNVAELFIRATDTNGIIYYPYEFQGNWTDEEKDSMMACIDKHVPQRVDSMYNNWVFTKSAGQFRARRATWYAYNSLTGNSLDELVGKVEGYHRR